MTKVAMVVTGIHDSSELLNGYLANFSKYKHEVSVYFIPDIKTLSFAIPQSVKIPSIEDQDQFLSKVGFRHIPYNSDNRRNVGYLMALSDGAEIVISIDDDNYCPENEDFVESHSVVLQNKNTEFVTSCVPGWFNNCGFIPGMYPRGFPYYARRVGISHFEHPDPKHSPVRINAGLWMGDPDMDAISWITSPQKITRYPPKSTVLNADTWCPINSQNTAVHRDLMPAYYFVKMNILIDRYGDIFQGYFALKVAKHMGWTARFGSPVVDHRRNSHNYFKDAVKEIPSTEMLEEFLPALLEAKLSGMTVHEACLSLADFVESRAGEFYHETARLMRLWASACKRING